MHTLRNIVYTKNNVCNTKKNSNEGIGSVVNISLNYIEKELLTSRGLNIDKVSFFQELELTVKFIPHSLIKLKRRITVIQWNYIWNYQNFFLNRSKTIFSITKLLSSTYKNFLS